MSAPNSCVAAGAEVAEAIAAIMGVTIAATEPDIARPGCYFGVAAADTKYLYHGLNDCRAAALLGGGMKVCTIGCLGLGTCARACPFDAIAMGPQGLPVVDANRCTGCGACERICPKHIINLSSVTRRILREYTTDECTTPCQRSCPAGIDIREYIRQIAQGNNYRAVQVIKERNPFPAVIGRICPRPCELDCRRNLVDEPVAINYLKRYAADFEKESGRRILPYSAPATGQKIAVVGGGVEGLSTAFFTARLGHAPTVFEAGSELGGLLRSAIAADRLPREILDWDIDGILAMGVVAVTGKSLGNEFSVASLLREEFKALFLASGGWDSRLARGVVSDLESPVPGTYLLVDFIRFGAANADKISCGRDVVIVGGGRLALEAAAISRQRGAAKITVLFRERSENSPLADADRAEINIDGVDILYDAAVSRLLGEADQLAAVQFIQTGTLETMTVPAQTLIMAAGRFPELIFVPRNAAASGSDASPQLPVQWEAMPPYKQPILKDAVGLFAEGEVLADYSAAIKAIGAGRRAAASIHQVLSGIAPSLTENVITTRSVLQDVDHVTGVEASHRQIMPRCSTRQLSLCGEIERGFTADAAQTEAARCLQCGLICYTRPSNSAGPAAVKSPEINFPARV